MLGLDKGLYNLYIKYLFDVQVADLLHVSQEC